MAEQAERLLRIAREQLGPEALEDELPAEEEANRKKLRAAFDEGFAEHEAARGREYLDALDAAFPPSGPSGETGR